MTPPAPAAMKKGEKLRDRATVLLPAGHAWRVDKSEAGLNLVKFSCLLIIYRAGLAGGGYGFFYGQNRKPTGR